MPKEPVAEYSVEPMKESEKLYRKLLGEVGCSQSLGETLHILKGDVLEIKRVLSDRPELDVQIQANFKGFVPNTKENLGDDRGFIIDTSQKLLRRFSRSRRGKKYPVVPPSGIPRWAGSG